MKQSIIVLLTIATLFSCDKGEDGSPGIDTAFFIENNTPVTSKMSFFISKEDSTQITIKPNEVLEVFYLISSPPGSRGLLSRIPYSSYNSVKIYLNDTLAYKFTKNDCPQSKNPLCEDSYTIVKNETDKNGNKYIETKFVLEG